MKAKKMIVASLLAIGLLAMCGEATEDVAATMAVQLLIFGSSWGLAVWLAKRWHIINK